MANSTLDQAHCADPPPDPALDGRTRLMLGAWQALLDHRLALEAGRQQAQTEWGRQAARLLAAEAGRRPKRSF